MAFTYTAKNPAARDQVRRKIGDTQAGNPVFQNEELDALLTENDSEVLLTAAAACREMAARAARGAINLTLPGVTISRQGQPQALLDMAMAFEAEATQRAVPTEANVMPQTDEYIEIVTDRQEIDFDFTTESNA